MTNEEKLRDYLKRVTADLHQTRERLRKLEDERLEPMAVVGMACRFPGGVASPDDFWTLLTKGTDTVAEFPQDRGPEWGSVFDRDPAAVGKSYAREGAFLYEAGEFDAQFFGISPREALAMDPQQRLLLESSWEALEHAGIDPTSLHGTATGVFAGLIYHDYAADGVGDVEGYVSTGISGGVASGRVAYTLGLEGPAVTVDTACSSSLVAMHLAAAALRSGECTLALAGGVTVMARPGTFVEFSRQRGLAADGRCKAYAEAADGTGWGEGVGVLVLEKLSDAQRNGHRVLAVLRGSAVNQDGASNGLTAPNGPAQQRVIQTALAGAGLSAGEVDVVEGHGTGTRLGDPIEAEALLATYGQQRDAERPLLLGSVKSNIGHTQAAAGVAGVIKMIQAMAYGLVPATLHVDAPSSHVDWAAGAVALVTEPTAWPETGRPRRAGISSFGFSGTNAHVIIEQAPEQPVPEPTEARRLPVVPWLLSARSGTGLAAQAERLASFVGPRPELDPADIGRSLAESRANLPQRAVVVGADRDELLAGLAGLAATAGEPPAAAAGSLGKLGFVFTGQGAQRLGMGRELYAAYPVFATAFDTACAGLEQHLGQPGRSLSAVLWGDAELLDQTMWAQAGLFAVEVALFRLLESWGVTPDAVAGHSIGELAAAHVAGVWSLADACAVVAARGRLMQALPTGGAMLAVQASEEEVRPLLDASEGVGLAAVNGPAAVVLSGPAGAVAALREQFEAQQLRVRNLRVSHAFHSSLMEPMLAEFAQVTASVTYQRPNIVLVSTVTGQPVTDEVTDPGYWVRQVREPVRFADAVTALRAREVRTFVELGPDGVLSGLGAQSATADEASAEAWLPTQRRDRAEALTLVSALGQLHARGGAVDWTRFYEGSGARRVDLPTYAFDRQRFWLNPGAGSTDVIGLGQSVAGHPLLGATVSLAASGGLILTGRLGLSSQPWLADHTVAGRVIVPGTALVEMAIRAGDEIGAARLAELVIEAPLVLPPAASGVRVQVVLDALDGGRSEVAIHSQAEDDEVTGGWTRHAVGILEPAARPTADRADEPTAWPPAGAVETPLDGFYPALAEAGLAYGRVFQGVRSLWRRGDETFAEVALADGVDVAGFGLHPALLDAALHGIAAGRAESAPLLPFAWTDVVIHATGAATARVRIAPAAKGDGVTVTLTDEAGELIATVGSLALQALPAADLAQDATLLREALFGLDWIQAEPAPAGTPLPQTPWAVIGRDHLPGLPDAVHHADLAELLAAVDGGAPIPDTAVLCCRPAPTDQALPLAARTLAVEVLGAIQDWLAAGPLAEARLLVVTERAVDAGPGLDPGASTVTGLVRSAAAENPGRLALADVDDLTADPSGLGTLLRAGVALGEPEFAVRQGQLLLPRLARPSGALAVPQDTAGWRLDFTERGTLENLLLAPLDAGVALGAGEVRVGLRAGGVNFRDVLNVLGMYPGDAGLLGLEGAGVVLEVGAEVCGLRPGDRVMGLFSGAFGPVAVTDARLLALVPAGWTLAEAAAAPVVYLTAWYALVVLAELRRGESVLIHAAAGGVGIAAVQLARYLGADVFGTASPAKWPVLHRLGLSGERVASSRTVEFEEAFRAATGGAGVDVVLDSLAGEFVDASLRLAAGAGGRFVEMGKTDIRESRQVAADHDGLSYQAFDLLDCHPDLIAGMFAELTDLFAKGVLRPLPVAAWDVRRAPEAFRYLSQARNIGKVVLTMPSTPLSGTALVTGASGALGGLVARELAARPEVANLLLLSRRGPEAPGVGGLAAELATRGVQVQLRAADVADHGQLAALLAGIPAEAPLRGVVHAAGVLDDGLVGSLTPARMHQVLQVKVDGAWHLHQLTRGLDLSLFVVFSSIAGIWGNPGQANYAAANTFLDALAAHRRNQGLPAVALAWGPWQLDGTEPTFGGMTGHLNAADWQRMAAQGLQPLSGADGLALLAAVTGGPNTSADSARALLVPARFDRASLRRRGAATPPLLTALLPATSTHGPARRTARAIGTGDSTGLAARLATLSSTEREETVRELVLSQAATVLGMAGLAGVDAGRSFRELGFDSLTAVELRNRLGEATGLRLPATLVFDYPTPSVLVAFVLTELLGDAASVALPAARTEAQNADDPVVIVGMGCRFPGGVGSPDEFWGLLSSETDAVTGFPRNRGPAWEGVVDPDPAATGKSYADAGGFLHDAGEFDAQFFGISPREALAMDPQQRLLLETSWEALEDAGIDPGLLPGSDTGVFTGLIYHDYSTGSSTPEEVEGYVSTGNSGGVASGRVSYALGLEGPAVTVDTACSSSLVALHLAVQALRSGECSLALAGGATVMATPGTFVEFSRQRGLAVDGRCKAYADAADGTGWGEGVGVLVVERLSDARRHGRRVLAVVRGTAVNQDGASNGLTAPNGPSQQRVIRTALAGAGLSAAEVDVVEGHGTGTRLGDPIEAQAVLATYGQGREAGRPVLLGSVKSNIGHTQAAAGVAGIIKMVQAMAYGVVPATLHVDAPSSQVDWEAGAVELVTEPTAWPETGRPRRAGISSFGFSGTNAHVIIEQAPEQPVPEPTEARRLPVVPWVISARSGSTLAAQATRLREHLAARPDLDPVDVGWSLATARAQLNHRAVVVGADRAELTARLADLSGSETAGSVGKVAFVFTGQGAQRAGMGRELYAAYPVFAEVFDAVCAGLEEHLDGSVGAVVRGVAGDVDDTVWAQAGLFAVEVALFRLLESWGVAPAVLAGHSIGELAAAHVAGVWSLADACAVVAARGRLMQALPTGGAMLAVQAGEADVRQVLARIDGVGIAAVNGPTAVVVSGTGQAVAAVAEAFTAQGVRVRNLRVSHAFHSALMEPMLAEFAQVTATVSYAAPRIPLVSTLTGRLVTDELTDPDYWVRQVREPVRFADAVTTLRESGVRTFVELGPDGVLSALGPQTATGEDDETSAEAWLATQRRDREQTLTLVTAVGQLYARGGAVDWPRFYAGTGAARVDLPSYAFDRQHYWLSSAGAHGDAVGLGLGSSGHPLLGAAVNLPASGGLVLTGRLSLSAQPWLADHVVAGRAVVPGAALAEMAIRAGDETGRPRLAELVIEAPLVLPPQGGIRVQVTVDAGEADGDTRRGDVAIYSQPEHEDPAGAWTRHATGVLTKAETTSEPTAESTSGRSGDSTDAAWPPAGAVTQDLEGFYPALAAAGLSYGPLFRGVRTLWRRGDELFAEVGLDDDVPVAGFGLHPALLDAALHPIAATGPDGPGDGPLLPFAWTDVVVHATGARAARVRLAPAATGDGISLTLSDATGALIATVGALVLRPLPTAQPGSAVAAEALFTLDWVPVRASDETVDVSRWAVLSDDESSILAQLPDVARFSGIGELVAAVADGRPAPDTVVIGCPTQPEGDDVPGRARAAAADTLELVREWLAAGNLADARLVLVTERAVDAGSGEVPIDLAGSANWGLVRVAASENPGRLALVDLDVDPAAEGASLRTAVATGEPQVAVRTGQLLVPRLTRARSAAILEPPADTDSWRLDFTERGTLQNLLLAPVDAGVALGAGEVRVGLRAGGVNFRDVLNVLGMYPGDAGLLGLEGAGVVLEVGVGVSGLRVGDVVMGLFSGAFAAAVVTDQRLLVRVPVGWSLAEAAAAPVVFLTAYYALVELAGLRCGESVLIHAAAGGVGIAAVQLAQHLGAVVLGTASVSKWSVLRGLGLSSSRVASSRTLDFEGEFRSVVGSVDVVLDSLAGEFVDASLRLAAGPGGRFVEMGKADVRDPEQVARDHGGLWYRAFDLLELDPDEIARMLAVLSELFAAGVLRPLPVAAWDVRRAPEAFRYLSQARNIGKVVLTVPNAADSRGTVLLTGASGALGGLVARHLAENRQAERLVLLSRRGPAVPGAARLAAELAAQGVAVDVVAADVADRAALARVIDAVPTATPLRGVVHAAGVLDDGVITSLTPAALDAVMRPKVDGAWHLHELTRGLDLSLFVVFSSIAGIWGNPGQGGYAAANTFLDALAAHRRRLGLPANSLAWGLWQLGEPGSEAGGGGGADGMAGQLSPADWQRLAGQGMQPLTGADGLALLDAVRGVGEPGGRPLGAAGALLVPARLDPSAFRRRGREVPALMSGLVSATTRATRRTAGRTSTDSGTGLAARLVGLSPAEQESTVHELVLTQAALVLGMAGPESVDADRSFRELGFDSLTAVELRNQVGEATGLRLPATLVFDYPTPSTLVGYLLAELGGRIADVALTSAPRGAAVDGDDPVVIVGMGCRFPGGVSSAGDFWSLLASGTDTVSGFPADRGPDWESVFDQDPAAVGKSYAREGAFLGQAADFDAQFFGISPREALAMDPQQRLLLETSWEALEDAGIDTGTLHGSETGVFTGLIYHDYSTGSSAPGEVEGYVSTGMSGGVASGRVSYALGLEGPAVTVDTACSSSLVALHLAVQALRSGECSLALAGGVTVMATPGIFVDFSRQRGLAADGRCKAYADAADGTGWGEGVGVLVVERLSDARRHGRRVLAVVRGTAVNQDGASNGLTAPNGPSQQRVIRTALAGAGLSAAEVDVVEGHGTGTRLGDPIEAQAVLATYGQGREAGRPVLLGSVKSNIGHTQAAAGVAGIIKMVQAMAYGVVPATLHVDAPSSQVDWEAGAVELVTEPTAWPETGRPRRAGISSFGFSGTNAHVIIEQAPEQPVPERETVRQPPVVPWVISARSGAGLVAQAQRLLEYAGSRPELEPADVGWSLTSSRTALSQRAVVVGADREELLAGLERLASGEQSPSAVTGATGALGKLGFVFTGQGAQRAGMGRELYAAYPVFAEVFDAVCAGLEEHLDGSVGAVVRGVAGDVNDTVWAQAGLFAVEVALFRLLESWGVAPAVLAGHSIGELAAAHVAGVWSLADACAVVAARGRLMQALPTGGAMLAIHASEPDVRQVLARIDGVGIAAVNGPTAVVVSGTEQAVDAVAEEFTGRGVRARKLRVSHAFHSPLMEPMLAEFAQVAASVSYRTPTIPLVSTVTGGAVTHELTDPQYWVRQVREPVRFADAVAGLRQAGVRTFVEIGPDAVLSVLGPETAAVADGGDQAEAWIPALRRDRAEPANLVAAVGRLYARGGNVDWSRFYAGTGARRVDLPTYAFTRERFWLTSGPARADAAGLGQAVAGHPLLGAAVDLPDNGGLLLTGRLSLTAQPWLADFRTAGRIVVPETALVEMAVRAGDQTGQTRLSELQVQAPLVLPDPGALQVQVVLTRPDQDGHRELAVYARPESEAPRGAWTRHATGVLTGTTSDARVGGETATEWPPPGAQPEPASTYRYIDTVWRRGEELFAEIALDPATDVSGFGLHPALLDAVLPLTGPGSAGDAPMLASAWTDVAVHATGADTVRARLAPVPGGGATSVTLFDGNGELVASVGAVTRRPLAAGELPAETPDSLFELTWTPVEPGARSATEQSGPEQSAPEQVALVGPEWAQAGPGWPGAAHYATLGDLVAALVQGVPVPDTIVVSGRPAADPAGGVAGAARDAAVATLLLLQQWLKAADLAGSRLVVLTEQAVEAGSEPVEVAGAAVWGLLRAAQSEYPGRIVLLDLDPAAAEERALPAVVGAAVASGQPQLAVRAGQLRVPRLVPATAEPTAEAADAADAVADRRGTLLVTGASGALGGLVARGLVGTGRAERVELLSRRGAQASGVGALAAELAGLGATARVTACDAADRDGLAAVIAGIPAETPLRGVVHAAGVLDDGVIESLTPARFEAVLRPKVDGAWNLHELTRELELDDFVLFSSMAGIWGNAGQGNYAAANTFLDALAAHRRRAGLPATSLAWGPWQVEESEAVGGMAGQLADADWQRMARHGLQPLGGAEGLARLDAVIERNRRHPGTVPALLVPVNLDLGVLRRHSGAGLPPLLSGLVGGSGSGRQARRVVGPVGAAEPNGLAARLAALPPAARERAVQDLVRAQSAQVLGLSGPQAIDGSRSFLELGLTSVTALELRNQLSSAAGLTLAASVIFDYPTPTALAGYLHANIVPAETALPVLDGLDQLASLLSAVDQDSDRRSEIIIRLEGLIADFRSRTEENATAYRELSVASDDEIFDLIDRELGI
ncbi:type I polyketide synthase [Streptacidiphilus sp. P02-A3a]|uniref:type I polyketide synthase n=1 Tax=Streptacidiphilus sp. P02-A3a TaxID=2704468 RepID=UPI0015FC58F1|nr:type I polyketide synthase [Streptacidiphilus sp. P02-A3a]QMU69834.1 SDR family NAD(P)-dependent oxidoreductase [Streptacidiphilus sp. P02-A3a]